MHLHWGYLEVLGGIIAILGTFAILPSCSFSNNFYYYYVFQCVNATTVYGREGDIGLLIAISGSVLFIVAEVGRRTNRKRSDISSGDSVDLGTNSNSWSLMVAYLKLFDGCPV